MPIFEYRCRACGERFEIILSSAGSHVVCKECESADLEMLLSKFAVSAGPVKVGSDSGPCGACGAPRRGMCQE
jgi:putative FmdB family regulatory protein